MVDVARLQDELLAAGYPVESVAEKRDGSVRVYLRDRQVDEKGQPLAHPRQAEVDNFLGGLLAAPSPPPIVAATLEDALVVLRLEPENASALALVKARYDELRRGGGG